MFVCAHELFVKMNTMFKQNRQDLCRPFYLVYVTLLFLVFLFLFTASWGTMLQNWWSLGKCRHFKTYEQGDEAQRQHDMIKHWSPSAAFVRWQKHIAQLMFLCLTQIAKYKDSNSYKCFFLFSTWKVNQPLFLKLDFVYFCSWAKATIIYLLLHDNDDDFFTINSMYVPHILHVSVYCQMCIGAGNKLS